MAGIRITEFIHNLFVKTGTKIRYTAMPVLNTKTEDKKPEAPVNPYIKSISVNPEKAHIDKLELLSNGNIVMYMGQSSLAIIDHKNFQIIKRHPCKRLRDFAVQSQDKIFCYSHDEDKIVVHDAEFKSASSFHGSRTKEYIQLNPDVMIGYLSNEASCELFIDSKEVDSRDPRRRNLSKAGMFERKIRKLIPLGHNKLVSYPDSGSLALVEWKDGDFVRVNQFERSNIISILPIINNQFIIFTDGKDTKNYLHFHDATSGECLKTLTIPDLKIYNFTIRQSQDGKYLYGRQASGLCRIEIATLAIHSIQFVEAIRSIVVLPSEEVAVLLAYQDIAIVQPHAFRYQFPEKKVEPVEVYLGAKYERRNLIHASLFRNRRISDLVSAYDHDFKHVQHAEDKIPVSVSERRVPSVHVALDIDGLLAYGFDSEGAADEFVTSFPYLLWFQARNLLLDAITCHVLYPGTLEFLQFLFDMPNVHVSFFSHGEKKRNSVFVEELLKLAFPENHHEKSQQVAIYSREDMGDESNLKKDLRLVLKSDDSLDRTILIDDKKKMVAPGQEKNCLWMPIKIEDPFCAIHDMESTTKARYFYDANHIFYIAGVLKRAFAKDRTHFAAHVADIQKAMKGKNPFVDRSLFLEGLLALQKYNNDLQFYGSKEVVEKHLQCKVEVTSEAAMRPGYF